MLKILIAVLFAAACWKWGAWKRWREFYPTILFVIIGDLIYNFIFYNFPLWEYNKLINHTISDLFFAFFVYPSVVIVFLTRLPSGFWKQAFYVLLWSLAYMALEYVSLLLGGIEYANGWTILWSLGLYLLGFTLIRVHWRHPFIVWPIAIAFLVLTAYLFKIPFSALK